MNEDTLKNKKEKLPSIGNIYREDNIVKAVEFFKRYRSNLKLLMEENEKAYKKWINHYESLPESQESNFLGKSEVNILKYIDKYNEWLFNYTFSDITTKGFLFN